MAQGAKVTTVSMLKAGPEDGLEEGQAKAMISVYDVIDHDRDRIKAGEFDSFVKEFDAAGDPLPVLWQHKTDSPLMCIGEVRGFDAAGRNEKSGESGLVADVWFDVTGDSATPESQQAYRLAKSRRFKQWSHRWTGERVKAEDVNAYDLKDVRLSEISLVLAGANSSTDTLGIKAAQADDAFAAIAAVLPPETLQMIGMLEPIDVCRFAIMADDFCRYKSGAAGQVKQEPEPPKSALSVIDARLQVEELLAS